MSKNNYPLIFYILFLHFGSHFAQAQNCEMELVWLQTQEDVNSFPANFLDCHELLGSLHIEPVFSNAINNLDSLIQLTHIHGDLTILNVKNLSTLQGLDSLQVVDGQFNINSNEDLVSLNHLSSLTTVKDFRITRNHRLKNLRGLEKITNVSIGFDILLNDSLRSLNGLKNIEKIGEDCNIAYNNSLENLEGLDQLHTVKILRIYRNNNLRDFAGLKSLTTINSDLVINFNPRLNSLNGLASLEFIGKSFTMFENESLNSLVGLESIKFKSLDLLRIANNDALQSLKDIANFDFTFVPNIVIEENDLLTDCAVQSFCNYISNCQKITLVNNGSLECNDNTSLQDKCKSDEQFNYQKYCNIDLFPIPANNRLNIRINGDFNDQVISFELHDMMGKTLIKGQVTDQSIDISGLAAGAYFLALSLGEQAEMFRIIKT